MTEPFPISLVSNRYLLYDVDVVDYVRRRHNMAGVLIGSLPQVPQQNVFLGLPLELMPEEARLLVEKGAAFIVDDVRFHAQGVPALAPGDKMAFLKALEKQGLELAQETERLAQQRRAAALRRKAAAGKSAEGKAKGRTKVVDRGLEEAGEADQGGEKEEEGKEEDEEDGNKSPPNWVEGTHSASALPAASDIYRPTKPIQPYNITPTTSLPPLKVALPPPHVSEKRPLLPSVPPSYPLFAYLHARGYFVSPGLRFGCQYLVYPGDPLRFHSHFLAVGAGWDEELDLLDIVGGGRLGTGVKKAFLIGGAPTRERGDGDAVDYDDVDRPSANEAQRVRAFCIEWGGM